MTGALSNPFQQRELPLVLTVDVCDGAFDSGDRKSRFGAMMEILPEIFESLSVVFRRMSDGTMPVTWFIRADSQVKEATGGDTLGLYNGWRDFWDDVTESGGELGWHPHLYRKQGDNWVPIRDHKKLMDEANRIWHDLKDSFWHPEVSRTGESVCSNELMTFLDSIGIRADSSALPGRKRDDGARWFDWEITPEEIYHPVDGDYRRPSKAMAEGDRVAGETSLGIMEIPFSMVHVRAPYDSDAVRFKRYMDLSFAPKLLQASYATYFSDAPYVLAVIHPLQAVGREIPEGGLVSGGIDVLTKNLELIFNFAKLSGRRIRPLTLGKLADFYGGKVLEDRASDSDSRAGVKLENRDARTGDGLYYIRGKKGGNRPMKSH